MARLTITFDTPSMAVQSAKSECDVHTILSQYRKTGVLPNRSDGYYDDCTAAVGFQDAFNLVISAEQQFAGLPATERARYANDVCAWMAASAARVSERPSELPAAKQPELNAADKAASADASTSVAAPAATTHSLATPPSEVGA